jgi:hypothetical protein
LFFGKLFSFFQKTQQPANDTTLEEKQKELRKEVEQLAKELNKEVIVRCLIKLF